MLQPMNDKMLLVAEAQVATSSDAGKVGGSAVTINTSQLIGETIVATFDVSAINDSGTAHTLAIQSSNDNFATVLADSKVNVTATGRVSVAHQIAGTKIRAYYTKGGGTGLTIAKAYVAPVNQA